MQNTLVDLNNRYFEQLDRLNDENLKGEDLEKEIDRSRAFVNVGRAIVENASLVLEAEKLKENFVDAKAVLPIMFDKKKSANRLGDSNDK